MRTMHRRHFLGLSGALAASVWLSSCGGSSPATTTLRWWDHLAPLEPLHKEIFEQFNQQHNDVTVAYELYNLPQLGQSLQLAFNSKQAPDVHTTASLNIPTSKLIANQWFTPLDEYVPADFASRFPEGVLLEGLHIFDGKLYSFPLFSYRSHTTLLWFNKQLMEEAGADPENGPQTWDDFRKVARDITAKGQGLYTGWIQAIQLAERLGMQVTDLAQSAGAAGDIDWKTGEYSYHSEPFVQAIEFLLALQKDGSLFPASTGLDARNARARFAAGSAGMNFDGPWSIGVMQNDYTEFLEQINVAQIPVPNANRQSYLYHGPSIGDFWISSQSEHPDLAAQVLMQLTDKQYYVKLAERMDQPPLDMTVVEQANVHETYRKALQYFEDIVRLAPSPLAKNSNTALVDAEMNDIRPNLGEIVQGAFSGTTGDYKGALRDYSDKMTAERNRAIKAVQDQGVEVSLDDWVFSNWDATKDYTNEFYQQ